uniref:ADAM metallopeptidase with thrombospondin type 1 motif 20 n=1 Tax=Eptatretus burgeri TaxID=7764 RepID=A0A8C4N2R3_EPTBU
VALWKWLNGLWGLVSWFGRLVVSGVENREGGSRPPLARESEVVMPVRVDRWGHVLPADSPLWRHRRSSEGRTGAAHTHYRLDAFGRTFYLNLTSDGGFLSPGYTAVHLGSRSRSAPRSTRQLKRCFYTGFVNAQRHQPAVLSLCSGLIGTFLMPEGEYFIEPLLMPERQRDGKERNRPHIIYRNMRQPSSGDQATGCGLPGKLAVARVYKDPSVGNLINIILVKLVIVEDEQEGPSVSSSAEMTLQNFCLWQQQQNRPDDNDPLHHDTAILITRNDICRARSKCDTLGLAEIGTVCDPFRSCSVSEDGGLSTAFTITHELGHVFNMPHDDSTKCRAFSSRKRHHVMAPTLNYETHPWTWSLCSRKYVTDFLDAGLGDCLLDNPHSIGLELPQHMPGHFYDANKQCELVFGPGSRLCPYMRQCKRLWCRSADGNQRGCRTQHMPLADGTECGRNMHCWQGTCVRSDLVSQPVDGQWGPWAPFDPCSRSCGGGVQGATRECNQPRPQDGGQYCLGRRMRFRSCKVDPCPSPRTDFREEQCLEFNGKHFNINGLSGNVRWVPRHSGILLKDRCKLYCRVAGSAAYYQLKSRVVDGTPCAPDTNDICVQGMCKQAGCDGVLNSKATKDRCGVCGGDNSSCQTVTGTFRNTRYGYNNVVQIPMGATSIDIRQHSHSGKPEDGNYLALSNSSGAFLLNGNFVVSMFKREVSVRGALLEYSGSDTAMERINSTAQLREEIMVQVLSVGQLHDPQVQYSFSVPMQAEDVSFTWEALGPWGECNKVCQGEHVRRSVCIRESDHRPFAEHHCLHSPKPGAVTAPCHTECELSWYIAGRSACSTQCGAGHQTLDVRCMQYGGREGMQPKLMADHHCIDKVKPPTRKPCFEACPPAGWQVSSWSQVRWKMLEHYDLHIRNLKQSIYKEEPLLRCFPLHSSCGQGLRMRHVECVHQGHEADPEECSNQDRPIESESCSGQPCPEWQTGSWGPCSVTCGTGQRQRAVWCQTKDSEMEECEATAKPSESKCSQSCGEGMRERQVVCRNEQGAEVDQSACLQLLWPVEHESCIIDSCAQWSTGDWGQCSVTCGDGVMTRQVACVGPGQHVHNDTDCSAFPTPEQVQQCQATACSTGPLSPHAISKLDNSENLQKESSNKRRAADQSSVNPHDAAFAENRWRTGLWGAVSERDLFVGYFLGLGGERGDGGRFPKSRRCKLWQFLIYLFLLLLFLVLMGLMTSTMPSGPNACQTQIQNVRCTLSIGGWQTNKSQPRSPNYKSILYFTWTFACKNGKLSFQTKLSYNPHGRSSKFQQA